MNLVASGIALVARRPFLKSTVRSAQNDCAQCFVQARAVVRRSYIGVYKGYIGLFWQYLGLYKSPEPQNRFNEKC